MQAGACGQVDQGLMCVSLYSKGSHVHRCEQELVEGSAKCSYARSQASRKADCAPKRRGRKARVARQ